MSLNMYDMFLMWRALSITRKTESFIWCLFRSHSQIRSALIPVMLERSICVILLSCRNLDKYLPVYIFGKLIVFEIGFYYNA